MNHFGGICAVPGIAVRLTLLAALPLLSGGCGPIEPLKISPLAGTWQGVTRNPGTIFTGRIEFDFSGDLVRLDMASYQQRIQLSFDGEPHPDDGNTYTATARTTLMDDEFRVNGFVEYGDGKHQGLTYITVEGTVRGGSMSGTVSVAYPDEERLVLPFDAYRR